MNQLRFSPFQKDFDDLNAADLSVLRTVAEGWYVDYKSQILKARDYGKALSAFANQYGGWLFVGIDEAVDGSRFAGTFNGIPSSDIPACELAIREGAAKCVSPPPYYDHRVFVGPAPEIGLASDRAIVAVRIPPGVDTPYVHVDGRIYRRVADSSEPRPETDRTALDSLWNRGKTARERLAEYVTREPILSKGEGERPLLHVFISSDPMEQIGRQYGVKIVEFEKLLRRGPMPFDNFFPSSTGYVARQVADNDPYFHLPTWHFDRQGHSSITIPLAEIRKGDHHQANAFARWFEGYEFGAPFVNALGDRFGNSRVIDLNMVLAFAVSIVSIHRGLLSLDDIEGPFYVKAHLRNLWRCVPFLDLKEYIDQITVAGVPIIQDNDVLCPPGTELDTFRVIPAVRSSTFENGFPVLHSTVGDALTISVPVLLALGVSPVTLATGNVGTTIDRAKQVQNVRSTLAKRLARQNSRM